MDDIYEDLDNFNDENTIAELQAENKDLKSRLEEHASALAKLQEDFDTLSAEYKKLELNYSSLLKTAKSEIERKTEIIKKLNIEKDEMVLKSLQNRNSFNRNYNKPTHNNPINQLMKQENTLKPEIDNRILAQATHPQDRTEKCQLPSKDPSLPNLDLRNKLLSLSKTLVDKDPRLNKNDVKENISLPKTDNDATKARALIRNRRKSMPAVRSEIERFSSDDENLTHARNLRENFSRKSSRENKHRLHNNFSETTNSRTSETPSLEDRHFGYNEPTHRSRPSRGERESYRTRSKSTHRNRHSPERPYRGSREYHDEHRFDYEKHRFPEKPNYRRNVSRSREPFREDYDRRHSQERPHRNQDRYPMKHKIQYNSDEMDSKRMKLDTQHRQLEEDQRLRNGREYVDNRYNPHDHMQPRDIQFSSCESPDYNYADPHHQVKEIKLTATTKLDDPRVSHKKYVVLKNDDNVVLSTSEGRNVNIIPLKRSAWGIEPVKMPDALMHKPPSFNIVNKINKVAESPLHNISIESGEICDEICNNEITPKETHFANQVETKRSLHSDKPKGVEYPVAKLSSYKIPKQKKTVDTKAADKTVQDGILSKLIQETTCKKKSKVFVGEHDSNKNKTSNKQEKIHDTVPLQCNTDLPVLTNETFDKHDKITKAAMKVVQDDLALSDDTCDNSHEQRYISKEVAAEVKVDGKKKKDHSPNHLESKCGVKSTNEGSTETKPIKLTIHLNKDKTTEDGKRKKRKTKHKESKEVAAKSPTDNENEKPMKKKGKETKPKEIKTKFSELFGDSNSLITPEDLGIPSTPAATSLVPDQCVPFLEDAQDAIDIKETQSAKDSPPLDKLLHEESKKTENKDEPVNITIECVEKKNGLKPKNIEEPIEVYKNLAPDIPDKQNVVKTVIISSGVQPQIALEVEKPEVHPKMELIRPTVNDVALKALATSTPYKLCENSQIDSKLSESTQSCDSDSRMAVDNSDTNTKDSQTKDNDAPDVRIIMKRRRRVIKK